MPGASDQVRDSISLCCGNIITVNWHTTQGSRRNENYDVPLSYKMWVRTVSKLVMKWWDGYVDIITDVMKVVTVFAHLQFTKRLETMLLTTGGCPEQLYRWYKFHIDGWLISKFWILIRKFLVLKIMKLRCAHLKKTDHVAVEQWPRKLYFCETVE